MGEHRTASQQITDEVSTWPGVEVDSGELGELAYKLGGRELGHVHGEDAAHFFFTKAVWAELRREGRITHHPVFPDKEGPAARTIESESDVTDVIALLRLNYDRAVDRRGLPEDADAAASGA